MPRPRATVDQVHRARKWILRHPDASITDTISKTKVSAGTIARLRRELIDDGLMKPKPHTPGLQKYKPSPTLPPDEPSPQGDEAEDILEGRLPMTREERRERLEKLVRTGGPDHVIRANNELEKMERSVQKVDDSGPPTPLTLEEAISDVADMIEALAAWGGEDAVRQATTTGLARFFEEVPAAPPQGELPATPQEPEHVA